MNRFFLRLVVLAPLFAGSLPAFAAEWTSEPPEVMAGGEIISQYYHLFSKITPPHRVWVKYKDQIYLCQGETVSFQCQVTETASSQTADQ